MTLPVWMPYALCGAGLIGLGLYGLMTAPRLLRRIVDFNVIGGGVFLLFGALARRGTVDYADPVPQAMISLPRSAVSSPLTTCLSARS